MAYEIKQLGVSAILDQSIKLIQQNFKLLAGITFPLVIPFALIQGFSQLYLAPEMPAQGGPEAMQQFQREMLQMSLIVAPLFLIFAYVVVPITNAAMLYAISRVYLGQPVTVGESFRFAIPRLLPLLGTWLLAGLAIMGGFVLCIVPGIIFSFWWALATQVVVLENLAGQAAMRRSKFLMKDNIAKLFLVGLIVALISGTIGGISGMIMQPHVKVIAAAFAQAVGTLIGAATGVVFYFSARCQHENFDLTLLAESVATPDAPVAAPDAEML